MEINGVIEFLSALGRVSAQAGALVLVVLVAQWVFRKQLSPRWRCALWLLVVLRLALPFSLASAWSVFNLTPHWPRHTQNAASVSQPDALPSSALPPVVLIGSPPKSGPDNEPPTKVASTFTVKEMPASIPVQDQPAQKPFSWSWPVALACLWLAGALLIAAHVAVSSVRLARKLSRLPTLEDPAILQLLDECRQRLGVRTKLLVVESAEISSPALHGFLRPRLLLPAGFTANFSNHELRFVFLHELAHWKRRDLWLNWLFALLQTIHWFNPLVWLAFARWRADRELACDAMALETAGSEHAADYGKTILRLLENFTHHAAMPGMVGILEDKRLLRRRIQMIANFKPASRWSVLALFLMALIGAACLTDAKDNSPVPAAPGRSASTSLPYALDLKPFYGKIFVGPGAANSTYKNFSGRKTIDGLPFDIDGDAALYGKNSDYENLPQEGILGVKIGRAFDELHLIHTAQWREHYGCPLATIRLHYANGSSHDFAIRYNFQVMDWARLPAEEKETIDDPDSKIIWRGPGVFGGTGRLFETVLHNPFPGKEVDSLDLLPSGDSRASYVLVAATVASSNPHREVTPALPLERSHDFDGTLKVHAVDAETGTPLAGVDVLPSINVDGNRTVADPILTSGDGIAVVKYPTKRTSNIGISVTKTDYSGHSGNWQSGNIPNEISYRLSHDTGVIQGVVLDNIGKPLAGAKVRIDNYGFEAGIPDDQLTLPERTATSDATGHWGIKGVPANYQNFGVTVTHPDYPQMQFFADGPHKRGLVGNHITTADFFSGKAVLRLSMGDELSGTVHDATGHPVSGAKLFVGFDRYMSGAIKANADDRGNFHLRNLVLGKNDLTISAPGFAPQFLTTTVTQNSPPLDIVMRPGKVIHGRVVDSSGKPIEGANVEYDGLAGQQGEFTGRTLDWITQTGPDGTFTWDSAPDHSILLTINMRGYMTLEWTPVPTDTTNTTTFTLGPPLAIKGSVTDADTGKPVAAFKVTPGWPEGESARFERQQTRGGMAGHYDIHFENPIILSETPYDFVLRISAPGYAPEQSRAIKPNEGDVTWDVKLKKTANLIGLVKTADGRPAAGIRVFTDQQQNFVQLDGTELNSQDLNSESFTTDDSGHFEFPPQIGDFDLLAASPAGFALVSLADFTNNPVLTLQPWGRVEGTARKNGKLLAAKEFYFFVGDGSPPGPQNLWSRTPVTSDEQGRFVFPNIPAGTIRIELKEPLSENSWSYRELQTIEVKPGATTVVESAFNGRDVIGRWKRSADLPADVDLSQGRLFLRPDRPPIPTPEGMDTQEKFQKWYAQWVKTDDGKKYAAAQSKMAQLELKPNGLLLAEAVAPGKYILSGNFWGAAGQVAEMNTSTVVVPEISADDSNPPVDIGEVVIRAVKHLKNGDFAPNFSAVTLEDEPFQLSDYRGKYVLVDFWATWCGPCVAETPNLKAAFDAYGGDARLVMLSLSLDQKMEQPKKFAQDHGIKWTQGFLGDWSHDNVTRDYGVHGIPSIFLVGPDGKIIAQNLRGEEIKTALASALATK